MKINQSHINLLHINVLLRYSKILTKWDFTYPNIGSSCSKIPHNLLDILMSNWLVPWFIPLSHPNLLFYSLICVLELGQRLELILIWLIKTSNSSIFINCLKMCFCILGSYIMYKYFTHIHILPIQISSPCDSYPNFKIDKYCPDGLRNNILSCHSAFCIRMYISTYLYSIFFSNCFFKHLFYDWKSRL